MAQTITEPFGATRLARAIASDLVLYNMPVIERGLREGRPFTELADELLEARHLFLRRVAARLDPLPLLLRALEAVFRDLAAQQGLRSDGLAEALAARLLCDADRLALLVVDGGHDLGRVIPLGDGVQEIGRVASADIEILVDSISRRHARVIVDGGRVTVEDAESTCGIFVNDEKVESAPLIVGDRLQLGGVGLTLIRVAAVESAVEPGPRREARTHALDRRSMLDALTASLARGGPLTLVLCELDHLDHIRERYGLVASDKVLSEVATRLMVAARAHQGRAIGRSGGAFLVLLPGPDAAVHERVEALRLAVTREPVGTREGPIHASLSIGVTLHPDAAAPDPEALLERAWAACSAARPPGPA